MASDTIIRVDGLWKKYGIMPALRQYWALREINLEVHKGETLGIIGPNGAGKTTLLKILAGITPPTRGAFKVCGRISSMIELNAGMHMELTGRENAYLVGAIMGVTRAQTRRLLPSIEEFCELGDYFDQPIRKYSSGMLARLGFAVAVNIHTDILLIDEVFAVGDLSFQQKCFRKMEEIIKTGATILFVSHAMRNIERVCEKAILLDKGSIVEYGAAMDVMASYFRIDADRAAQELLRSSGGIAQIIHTGTQELRITGAEVLDASGQPADVVRYKGPFTVRLHVRALRPVKSPHLMIIISTPDIINVAAVTTGREKIIDLPEFTPGEWIVDCHFPKVSLLPGVYMVNASFDSRTGPRIETVKHIKKFQVVVSGSGQQENNIPGFFWLDCRWEWQRL